jgi:hypothetical protein
MASNYVATNLQTADWRIRQNPAPLSTEARIKLLRRYLADRYEFAWMESYKKAERELAELEAQS